MDMGRGEERVMYGKGNMETYITLCKIDSQWGLLYGSGNSTWVGWGGRCEGGSKARGYMYTYG